MKSLINVKTVIEKRNEVLEEYRKRFKKLMPNAIEEDIDLYMLGVNIAIDMILSKGDEK